MEINDLSGILNLVSQNPSIVQGVLKGLSTAKNDPEPVTETKDAVGEPESLIVNSPCERRRRLLRGVRPYLCRERSQRLDMALSLLGVLEAFGEGGDESVQ